MIHWNEGMSVGVRELDEQHQHLFSLVNGILAAAAKNRKMGDDFLYLLNDVSNYTLYHLGAEEEYMDTFDCSFAAHLEEHKEYRQRLKIFLKSAEAARRLGAEPAAKYAAELAEFAGHWHVAHIIGMDKGYTRCFNEHGLF